MAEIEKDDICPTLKKQLERSLMLSEIQRVGSLRLIDAQKYYFESLLNVGFTRHEAIVLLCQWIGLGCPRLEG